ncbi:hypothetical protein LPJ71_011118, partial [Coemansia sp. S17]
MPNRAPNNGGRREELRPVLSPTPTPTPQQPLPDDSFPDIHSEQWRTPDTLGLDVNNQGQIFYFANDDKTETATTTATPQLHSNEYISKLAEVNEKQDTVKDNTDDVDDDEDSPYDL